MTAGSRWVSAENRDTRQVRQVLREDLAALGPAWHEITSVQAAAAHALNTRESR